MANEIDDSNSNFITNIVNKSGDTYYLRDINTYTKAETDNRITIARNELQNRIVLLEQSNTNGITKAEANATFLKKTEISGKADKSTTINGIPLSSSYIMLNGDNIYANFEDNQLSLNNIFKVTGKVKSINDITPDNNGSISLTKTNIGLGNVDNTSDTNKPVSIAVQTELNKKVNVIEGKSLSTNDLTDDLKNRYDSAVRDQHTHGNKAILDATTEAFTGHQDISGKADKSTVYTKTETDTLLNAKVDSSSVYTKTEVNAIKTELLNNITTKIAEVVANAPEDFNTLKEISDWITKHADSASAMNTAIQSKYKKPENGIPLSDLNEDVQASINKANTALQEHQDVSNKATKAAGTYNYGTNDFYYHTGNNESYLNINNTQYDVTFDNLLNSSIPVDYISNDETFVSLSFKKYDVTNNSVKNISLDEFIERRISTRLNNMQFFGNNGITFNKFSCVYDDDSKIQTIASNPNYGSISRDSSLLLYDSKEINISTNIKNKYIKISNDSLEIKHDKLNIKCKNIILHDNTTNKSVTLSVDDIGSLGKMTWNDETSTLSITPITLTDESQVEEQPEQPGTPEVPGEGTTESNKESIGDNNGSDV